MIQSNIMDIGQPLNAFHSQVKRLLQSKDPDASDSTVEGLERGLEVSIQQWTRAFAYVPKCAFVGLMLEEARKDETL